MISPPTPDTLARAARLLREGSLVAFPTETVYGLGADAGNEAAVRAIFAAKGRPADHPVIVHVEDLEEAAAWADTLPHGARRLAEAFWPGPLTLIVPRAAHVGVRRRVALGDGRANPAGIRVDESNDHNPPRTMRM